MIACSGHFDAADSLDGPRSRSIPRPFTPRWQDGRLGKLRKKRAKPREKAGARRAVDTQWTRQTGADGAGEWAERRAFGTRGSGGNHE